MPRALVAVLAAAFALCTAVGAAADNNTLSGSPAPPVAATPIPATPVTACEGPAPVRTGRVITEKRQSLQIAMALAALIETGSVPVMHNASAWWCIEKELTAGSLAVQVWRSTRAADGVTSVLRFSVRGRSAAVYVVFSALASAPLNDDRDAQRLTWRAHVLYGPYDGGWAVFRIFDGEPAPEIVAPLVAKIADDDLTPIVSLDGQNKLHFGRR